MRHNAARYAAVLTTMVVPWVVHAQTARPQETSFTSIELAYGINTEEKRQALREIDALRGKERWQEMAGACSNAVALFPSPIYFQRWLTAAERVGPPALLVQVYTAYMEKCPGYRPQLYGGWADAMRRTGRGDEAIARLREWIRTVPRDPPFLWKALADLLIAMDRPDEAERAYRESMEQLTWPAWQAGALDEIARISGARRNVEAAIRAAEKELDASFKDGLFFHTRYSATTRLIGLLQKAKGLDEYAAKLEKRIEAGNRPAEALVVLIQIAESRREDKRAAEYYRKLARLNVDVFALFRCYEVIVRTGSTNDEIAVIEKILADRRNNGPQWLPRLAQLYAATGNTARAASLLDEMVAKNASPDTLVSAAGIAVGAGLRDRATKWIDEARRRRPGDEAMCRIAGILVTLGRHEDAIDCLFSISPSFSMYHVRTPVLDELCKAGYRARVAERFAQITDAQPTNSLAWAERARFCHRGQDYTNAAACWKRVTELAPSSEAFRSWIAAVRALNDPAALVSALDTSFKAYPRAETATALVTLLVGAGRTADALAIQRQVAGMARTPAEKTTAHLALVRLLLADRQNDAAQQLMAEILGSTPPEAVRKEAEEIRTMMDANRRHDEFVRKAIERADLVRSEATAQRSAAQALRLTGRHAEAASYYRRALALEDQTATRWDLACALTSAGKHAEAVVEYRAIMDRDLSQQEREAAIKAVVDGWSAIGETRKALDFLATRQDDIKTPGVRKWATARIQALRETLN